MHSRTVQSSSFESRGSKRALEGSVGGMHGLRERERERPVVCILQMTGYHSGKGGCQGDAL